MATPWETLQRAGVPLGTRDGPPVFPEGDLLVSAVREALEPGGSERERLCLLAWLRAWWSEWPTSFAATFGAEGQHLLARAQEGEWDRGRYLKLRRIASENLSRLL